MVACGSGGSNATDQPAGGVVPPPAAPTPPPTPAPPPSPPPQTEPVTAVNLVSGTDDFIGLGQEYSYTKATADITLTIVGSQISIRVQGDELWNGDFVLPNSLSSVQVGDYVGLTDTPHHDPAIGGMNWGGEARACAYLAGSVSISEAVYDGDTLSELEMSFEQFCTDRTEPLRGEISWYANDDTAPADPVSPPPADLWEPGPEVAALEGNYIYLESDSGDFVGAGNTYLYTGANAALTTSSSEGFFSLLITGDQRWRGNFRTMSTLDRIETGYYGSLKQYPSHNPTRGGLKWTGEGRGCNRVTGWFVVDEVTYDDSVLTSVTLRFEQYCDASGGPLRGAISWDRSDPTVPPGPVVPPPADLWKPEPGTTPQAGTYVYLESDPTDFIGDGGTYLYTLANSFMRLEIGADLAILVHGDERWTGLFEGMDSMEQLETGYYGDVRRFPFHNPVKGGMRWGGEGRGCNALDGWFVVDSIVYDEEVPIQFKLRFEQHCELVDAALRGEVHWDSSDPTTPPGPVNPPPGNLWAPPSGVVPATGSFAYFESEDGDFVGQGDSSLHTRRDSSFNISAEQRELIVGVNGDENWGLQVESMISLSQFELGLYEVEASGLLSNPIRGRIDVSHDSRTCTEEYGWFVIDAVEFDESTLTYIDLRFESRCAPNAPAVRGQFRWDTNDLSEPPGPVSPPPAGLWAPDPTSIPNSDTFVYLESEAGDSVGRGERHTYTPDNSRLVPATTAPNGFRLLVHDSDIDWDGEFRAMVSRDRLEPGYYGDLRGSADWNPAKGTMEWKRTSRCQAISGWFVVDNVVYAGDLIQEVALRFGQYCNGSSSALHGAIGWVRPDP